MKATRRVQDLTSLSTPHLYAESTVSAITENETTDGMSDVSENETTDEMSDFHVLVNEITDGMSDVNVSENEMTDGISDIQVSETAGARRTDEYDIDFE